MNNEDSPKWAKPGVADNFGNVACKECGEIQSPTFGACVLCCPHDELTLVEAWHGPDVGGGWELDAVCTKCGKNFFSRAELLRGYKLVKIDAIVPDL